MPPLSEPSIISQPLASCSVCEFQRRLDRGDGQHCVGRMANSRMNKRLRCLAVKAYCIVQGLVGFILSLLALVMYQIFPTLRQPPPAHVPAAQTLRHQRETRRRLGISHPSSGVSSDSSLESPHGRELQVAIPHDTTMTPRRNHAARRRTRAVSSTLPTLTESSQSRPSSAHDRLSIESAPVGDRSSAQSPPSTEPSSDAEAGANTCTTVGPRRKASFRLSYFLPHKHSAHALTRTLVSPIVAVTSLPHLGHKHAEAQQRAKSWPEGEPSGSAQPQPQLQPPPESQTEGGTWVDRAPEAGVSHKWKLAPLHHAPKKSRAEGRPAARTHPYEAPYFFPSPASPDAEHYVSKARESTRRTRGVSDCTSKRSPSPHSSVASDPVYDPAGRAEFEEPVRARSWDDASGQPAAEEEHPGRRRQTR